MVTRTLLVTTIATLAATASAAAAQPTVAYIDGHNLWFASADGALKRQITTTGTEQHPFQAPSQGPDGTTVAVRKESFDSGQSFRPVLYRYSGAGAMTHGNVMPVYSGATIPVYPIGLDMDWQSNAVAYGYSYCGFACKTTYRGFWLTFSDNQGLYPSNPQGQSDAHLPTFYGKRVVSSDSGGSLFIQPDVAEAPFTSSYQGWLSGPDNDVYFHRADVAAAGRQVALDWSPRTGEGGGIMVGEHPGTIPGGIANVCNLPVAGDASNPTFSYDGTLIAWQDAEGVKVAGAPNLAAGTPTCTLSAPVRVISATGTTPHLGGADPAVWNAAPGGGAGGGTGGGAPGGHGGTTPGTGAPGTGGRSDANIGITVPASTTRARLRRGLPLTVTVPTAGRITATASVPASIARRLRLRGATFRLLAAKGPRTGATIVARGSGTAKRAGTARVTLKLTAKARRRVARLRGVRLTVKVSQGAATTQRTLRVR